MKNLEKKNEENVHRAAFLNTITAWIDKIVVIIISFILNPLIIAMLGPVYYGVWQMLGQLTSYMATADFRSATTIKWILARDRSTKLEEELNVSVSSAFWSNLIMLPLYVLVGGFIIYFSPFVTKVGIEDFELVRWTSFILVITFIMTQFFFVYESVLHGMNISYKRMGIRGIILAISGVLTYYSLVFGYNMIGMSIIQSFSVLTIGIIFFLILKKQIKWFKLVKVELKKVISFLKLTGGFMLVKIGDLLNQSVDLLLLGFFADSLFVTLYTVSRYVMSALSGLISQAINSVTNGITKYIGESKYDQLREVRNLTILINWVMLVSIGAVVILCNKSFVILWTGIDKFAGIPETLLIVTWIILRTQAQTDVSIILMKLDFKNNLNTSIISSVIIIVLSVILIPIWKILGLLIALNLGITFVCCRNAIIVGRVLNDKKLLKSLFVNKAVLVGVFILSLSTYFASFIRLESWLFLFIFAIISFSFILLIVFQLSLKKEDKMLFVSSLRKIKQLKR